MKALREAPLCHRDSQNLEGVLDVWLHSIASGLTLPIVVASLLAGAVTTAAAHGASPPASHAGSVSHALRFQRGWMARDADARHAWLYISSEQESIVDIYDLEKVGIPQVGEITDGLVNPTAMTIDPSGTLYVANYYGGTVSIYAAGSTSPTLTLSSGLVIPNGVAVDAVGNLYVTNKSTPPDIVVYPPGQTTPSTIIDDPLIQNPGEIVFDAAGNLYLADSDSGVSEMPVGSGHFVSLGLQGISFFVGAVAIDPLDGFLFASGTRHKKHGQGVLVFPAGAQTAARSLKTSAWADFLALGMIRHEEYVFVPDSSSHAVSLFKHDSNKATYTLSSLPYARGVAYKPAGVP
jgi:DNA-binding beta-propeller fold protein YncE